MKSFVNYLAGLRKGTHSTKVPRAKSEAVAVSHGARKVLVVPAPGTVPVLHCGAGGSIIFGPKPRDYSYRVNKKKVSLAMRSALSDKVSEEAIGCCRLH